MYIYLVKNKDHTKFKVGYTSATDPRKRLRNYFTHNSDIDVIGVWKVKSKTWERIIHLEIMKAGYIKDSTKYQQEWFHGNILLKEIDVFLNKYEAKV